MVTKIKGVLIDMDGTLVDSLPALKKLYYSFLNAHGHKGSDEEFDELNGPSLLEVMKILVERYGIDGDPQKLFEEYRLKLYRFYLHEANLFPGAMDVLFNLWSQGIKAALVTASPALVAKRVVEGKKLDHCFDAIVTPDGWGGKGKPSPDLFNKALSLLGLQAYEVVAIEDSENGVRAARSAGIYTCHIFGGTLPDDLKNDPGVTEISGWVDFYEKFIHKGTDVS